MEEQDKKKIDESYKEKVEKEKEEAKNKEEFTPPEVSFSFFVTTIGIQAAISLGDMPNPQNNKKEENLPQARFLIDTLGMIKEKTQNNLSKEESGHLEEMLYELRLCYAQKCSNTTGPQDLKEEKK